MSQPIDDGVAAFPHEELVNNLYDDKGRITGSRVCYAHPGMSLRDWFAGQASEHDIEHHMAMGYVAGRIIVRTREQAKYAYADAMLAARKGGDQ